MVFEELHDYFVKSALLLMLLFVMLVACWTQKHSKLPPGPWRFPFIGFFPQLIWSMFYKQEELHMLATRLGQKYGDIYSFDLFGHVIIVINDFVIMKEANNNPALSDKGFNNELEYKVFGSTMHSYKHMVEFRKFALSVLRGFGFGIRSFEANIADESRALSEEVEIFKGKPCNPHHLFVNSVTNVFFAVLFGERHDYDDEKFRYLTDLNGRIVHLLGAGLWSAMLPKYYPTKESKEILKIIQEIYNFIDNHIEEHMEEFDAENPKDFIDTYLKVIEELPKPDDPFSYLQRDNMRALLYLLFLAGADTTSTTLDWCCVYMMAYPNIQKQIQKEIDSVVGRNRLPQLSDESRLPYTRAVLSEIHRHVTLMPLSDFHTASARTTLSGYQIPKGATIVSNIFAVMRDPITFPEPDRFMPERFIDESGEYVEKVEVCPFGVGRRACIGDQFASMELFIFFTHLLHRYSLVKPEGASPITLEGINGASVTPKPFTTNFVIRE